MDAAARIEAYYDALREGEPLAPFFARGEDIVKFGISEKLVGHEEIERGLREQTETTTDWTVDSRDLRVTERDRHAWFSDEVAMAWTDTDRRIRFEFDSRWSGTLERRSGEGSPSNDGEWRFVGMHVSTAGDV